MKCMKCGNEISAGSRFCERCGEPVRMEKRNDQKHKSREKLSSMRCNYCGASTSPGDVYCDNCGKKIENKRQWYFVVLAGMAVVVILVLVLICFIMSGKDKKVDSDYMSSDKVEEKNDNQDNTEPETEESKAENPETEKPETQKQETTEVGGAAEVGSAALPTSAQLISYTPDISSLVSPSIIGAQASSTIQQEGKSNDPILLFDGRDDTNWEEGVVGYGIGENVSFSFDRMYSIKYIGFKLGNWKNDRYYTGNAKPKTMTLILGDFSGQVTFTGQRNIEWVQLSNKVNADSMRIEINDVYPGTQWEDTCITEILLYGDRK